MIARTRDVADALDAELRIADFTDSSHNGLQVSNSGAVSRICCGVDASLDFFRDAKDKGADLCLVHHGISWGDSLAKISGSNYEIVSFLINNDIALYAAHLPIDAHPVLGNNAQIAAALGLVDVAGFCNYHGNLIGRKGRLPEAIPFSQLHARVRAITPDGTHHALQFGSEMVQTVGIVSGGAAGEVSQAAAERLDCFITGEMNLEGYNTAKHESVNVISAGHYATERFGVKAVGEFLQRNFKLPFEFIDLKLPW